MSYFSTLTIKIIFDIFSVSAPFMSWYPVCHHSLFICHVLFLIVFRQIQTNDCFLDWLIYPFVAVNLLSIISEFELICSCVKCHMILCWMKQILKICWYVVHVRGTFPLAILSISSSTRNLIVQICPWLVCSIYCDGHFGSFSYLEYWLCLSSILWCCQSVSSLDLLETL